MRRISTTLEPKRVIEVDEHEFRNLKQQVLVYAEEHDGKLVPLLHKLNFTQQLDHARDQMVCGFKCSCGVGLKQVVDNEAGQTALTATANDVRIAGQKHYDLARSREPKSIFDTPQVMLPGAGATASSYPIGGNKVAGDMDRGNKDFPSPYREGTIQQENDEKTGERITPIRIHNGYGRDTWIWKVWNPKTFGGCWELKFGEELPNLESNKWLEEQYQRDKKRAEREAQEVKYRASWREQMLRDDPVALELFERQKGRIIGL